MKKRIIISIIVIILIVTATTGLYLGYSGNLSSKKIETQQIIPKETNNKELSYSGKDGITALVLLEQNATIKTSGTGEMAYVTTINGLSANPTNEYWQFNINGESASVGAGSYVTKSSDTITWKLSSF